MPFPLPDCVQAVDLELYICDEAKFEESRIAGENYRTSYMSDEGEEETDPRFLIRPSAPICGQPCGSGDDDVEINEMEYRYRGNSLPYPNNTDLVTWLDSVPPTKNASFDAFVNYQRQGDHLVKVEAGHLPPSFANPNQGIETDEYLGSESEDGEGDLLYEMISFGKNRVGMSFISHRPDWDDAYDFIMKGMAGMFYSPLPCPRIQYTPTTPCRHKRSQLSLEAPGCDDRISSSRPKSRKPVTPLRVRLLSTSIQSRAMAVRDILSPPEPPSAMACIPQARPDPTSATGTSHQVAEFLNGWELKAIESLYELERIQDTIHIQ